MLSRYAGLAFIAACVACALSAANALAASPEFAPFGNIYPLGFRDSLETRTTLLETAESRSIECKELEAKGEVVSATEAKNIEITLRKCKSLGLVSGSCTTTGQASEVIKIKGLKAKPVFINEKRKLKEERGLDFTPGAAGPLAEFTCSGPLGSDELVVENTFGGENSVIGVIKGTEVDEQEEELTITFSQAKGVQSPTEWEEEFGMTFTRKRDFLEMEGVNSVGFGESFLDEQTGLRGTITMELDGTMAIT